MVDNGVYCLMMPIMPFFISTTTSSTVWKVMETLVDLCITSKFAEKQNTTTTTTTMITTESLKTTVADPCHLIQHMYTVIILYTCSSDFRCAVGGLSRLMLVMHEDVYLSLSLPLCILHRICHRLLLGGAGIPKPTFWVWETSTNDRAVKVDSFDTPDGESAGSSQTTQGWLCQSHKESS